jgi:phosphoribosyl-dephospho-CoA transferase
MPTRHDRVWLHPSSWRAGLRAELDAGTVEQVDRWIRRGRAAVARRRDPHCGDDDRCLGIALPIAHGRRRIALVVDRQTVVRVEPPLTLDAVIDAAPFRCRAALADLSRGARDTGTTLSVYGSFAWQAISVEACVTAHSDLDLLWDAATPADADRVIALLLDWESASGIRADGEVRLPNGDAVAWRELASDASRVLVKRDDGVALRPLRGRGVAFG